MEEKAQEEIKAPEKPEAPAQVPVEQLLQEKAQLEQKLKQMEKVISKHESQTQTLSQIYERLDNEKAAREEEVATMLDSIESLRASIEGGEVTAKHHEQLIEKRKQEEATKSQAKSLPKEVEKFLNYCEENDLHLDPESLENCDPLVKEALAEGRNFGSGLGYLKSKVKARSEEKSKKSIQELTVEVLQQQLKDLGLTKEAIAGPSASARDLSGMSPMELAREAYREKKK